MIVQNISNIIPTTQCHIPEDLNLWQHHTENLESCMVYVYRAFPVTGCPGYLQPVRESVAVLHNLLLELNMANIWTQNISHPSFLAAKTPSNWLVRPTIMTMSLGERACR